MASTSVYSQKHTGRVNKLITHIGLAEADGGVMPDGSIPYTPNCYALWDTGATASCISPRMAKSLGLSSMGGKQVKTAGGETVQSTYHVSIKLPNKIYIPRIVVTEANLSDDLGFDALIGMDLISQGDFAITHGMGDTVFSFRMPSQTVIDFRENDSFASKPGRNDPCSCGSGKKFKKCCMRSDSSSGFERR